MARTKRGSGTPATLVLDRAGVAYTLHPYEHDPQAASFGAEAAAALEISVRRIFKTLMVELTGRQLVTAVVPVAGMLDLKALADAVDAKRAAMADPAMAERVTGMVVGGITPIGQRTRHRTVIDASASDFDTVFCSAGRRGLQLELAPADLVHVTDAVLAPIGR